MKKYSVVLVLLVLAACGSQATPAPTNGSGLRVVTTMSILADIIKQVGGERVQVENLIPVGAGPEDYQATPADSQTIANAQMVFFNGLGLEEWLEPLFANAGNDQQTRIDLSAGLPTLADDNGSANPHVWLDPTYVMSYTVTIKDELSKRDPAGATTYAANAEAYLKQLQALDADLRQQADQLPVERRKLITNHDAFPYFARHYGFDVIGVILQNPEAELSAGDLSSLVEVAKTNQIPAIFAESQFSQKNSRLLADEAGIKTIAVLYTDSLGSDTPTYIEMMRYNMRTVVAALQ